MSDVSKKATSREYQLIHDKIPAMINRSFPALFLAIILVGCSIACVGRPKESNPGDESVRKFSADFYEWYVKAADGEANRLNLLATKEMRKALAPELLQQLKQDFQAQAQDHSGYIVGLDFDPFLNAQDPCDRYGVRNITKKGGLYWAEIHGVGGCAAHDSADLTTEVIFRDGSCMFTNFHYPGRFAQDLRSLLVSLRRDRAKTP
jgi:hypothetical protein